MKNLDRQDNTASPIPTGPLAEVMEAGRRIHAAVDALDALVSERLGVHRSDLRCLNLLEHGPLTPGEIAARTGLSTGAVTALLDRLERAGFAERRRSETDRRSVLIAIPAEAWPRIAALYREVGGAVMARFAAEPPAEVARSAAALRGFAEALETGLARLALPQEGRG
jgi:DNA-binding MarR family transcriptional regulator